MNLPNWTRPVLVGAAIGAVVVSIVGFSWGGWMTGSSAEKMARVRATDEVTQAMVPICLDIAASDPQREAKLSTVRAAAGYNRQEAVMNTGWATVPGAEKPNRALARACMERLDLDAS